MRISSRLFTIKKTKGRTCVRPLLVTRFIRLHPGAQKGGGPTWGRCPSRATSKTSLPTLNRQRNSFRSYNETSFIAFCSKNLSKSFQNHIRCSPMRKCHFYLEIERNPQLTVWLQTQPSEKSLKILVCGRDWMTFASGIFSDGESDSRKAVSLPAPEASTQTFFAAAMVA